MWFCCEAERDRLGCLCSLLLLCAPGAMMLLPSENSCAGFGWQMHVLMATAAAPTRQCMQPAQTRTANPLLLLRMLAGHHQPLPAVCSSADTLVLTLLDHLLWLDPATSQHAACWTPELQPGHALCIML